MLIKMQSTYWLFTLEIRFFEFPYSNWELNWVKFGKSFGAKKSTSGSQDSENDSLSILMYCFSYICSRLNVI